MAMIVDHLVYTNVLYACTISIMDILISGAGVAGPALALWLHRLGHRTTVVERAPVLRTGGYAVDFRGHVHLDVLTRMGMLDEIRRRQTNTGALGCVDGDGRVVATMPSDIFSGDVEIRRGDLAEVLFEATRAHTEYRFGTTITSLTQHDDGVDVTFSGGAPERYDLVVGADGLHSQVRALAFGPSARYLSDLGLLVAVYDVPNFLDLRRTGRLYSTPGRTAAVFSSGEDGAIASFTFAGGSDEAVRDVAAQQALLRERFAGQGWHCDRLLAEMPHATDFYFDSTAQVRMDRWHTGRVVLLGDAGYAAGPGGNGTGTAVVGAYVLAGELARAGGDHRTAFPRYESMLRDYVARGQKQALGSTAFLAPATWRRIRQRNRFFRLAPYLPVKGLIKRAADRTATAVTLPGYPMPVAV
jgi:2-polyprenyl-6-methoxyphenol hydroxylase-like FAD-dependent oxidoreductase